MYGMYGNYGVMATQSTVGLVLAFIAFVAAIVVTVILYRKFISVDNTYKVAGVKGDWGPFFRFEHLIIENILKVIYIFTASLIAFECAGSIITSLFSFMYNSGAAFGGIIFILILFVVLEVINRLWFEFALLTVLIWKNTSAIRKSVAGDAGNTSSGMYKPFEPNTPQGGNPNQSSWGVNTTSSNSSVPTQSAPAVASMPNASQSATPHAATPEPTIPQSPVQAPAAPNGMSAQPASAPHSHNSAWTCPSCGALNKTGSFCAQCGTRKNN